MQKLKSDENFIFSLLDDFDPIAIFALNKLIERFSDDDAMYGTEKAPLIEAIYIRRYNDRAIWKLAIEFNIADRTLYRYRHQFIKWFRYYYDKYKKQTLSAA